jgi:hypothetical protein
MAVTNELKKQLEQSDLEKLVSEYFEVNKLLGQIKYKRDKLNESVKVGLKKKPGVYEVADYEINLYEQDKSSFDQEKLVKLLVDKELTDCFKVVMVPIEEKVENALHNEKITQEELEACVVPKIILAMSVKERKLKKEI